MGTTGLRTSLIWHDEVMNDLVSEKPAKVTIGSSSEATFVTPEIAGAPSFAIVTPGRRGYLLTLSDQMSGTICIDGVEHEVAAFVRASDETPGFRATPISGNDWGVISLDASGDHKLFFQFVPLEEQDWNLAHPMILAAVGGFALSVAVLTGLWWWKGVSLGEAAFRAGSLSSLAIGFAAIVRWVLKQDNESRASLAFSVMLHAAILFATFQLYERAAPFEWPKPSSTAGSYLVKAEDIVAPKPEPVKPTVAPPGAAAQQPAIIPPRRPWTRPKGKKVEHPTVAAAITTQVPAQTETGTPTIPSTKSVVPAIGLFVHEDLLHGVLDDKTAGKAIQKVGALGGPKGPPGGVPGAGGPGTTVGGGDGKGPAGELKGGPVGPLKIGKLRDAVCMGAGCGTGPGPQYLPPPKPPTEDGPTLSSKEIDDLIKSRQAMYRSCYQKQLNRDPSLAGDFTLHFEIGGDGLVRNARRTAGSMTNPDVIQCVKNALGLLHFPQKGGAIVNYPFGFSAGQ